jgi:hypothetical protein
MKLNNGVQIPVSRSHKGLIEATGLLPAGRCGTERDAARRSQNV